MLAAAHRPGYTERTGDVAIINGGVIALEG